MKYAEKYVQKRNSGPLFPDIPISICLTNSLYFNVHEKQFLQQITGRENPAQPQKYTLPIEKKKKNKPHFNKMNDCLHACESLL